MGKLAMGVYPGLVGSACYDFALKLADAAANKGHKVSIWFSGNATGSVKAHQKHLKDYSTGEKYLTSLLERGVEICTCEACTIARGVQKPEGIEKIKWSAMHWYLGSIHAADRVLHIGGE
ncbi:MAG: DsrE family protein [Nitrospiraceae bacterium]|nr:DsrE family protein [Nitrospiraceae bacterium]